MQIGDTFSQRVRIILVNYFRCQMVFYNPKIEEIIEKENARLTFSRL